jgi:ligand-binding sensor domain-containing protein
VGAAVFDGQTWQTFTTATSGLVDDWVLSLAIAPRPEGDWVWFGTRAGISRLDTGTGEWADFSADLPEGAGVVALTVDASGRLWAGTLGDGLGLWDGETWQFYRTGNSDIPFNTVNAIVEIEPGVLWVGTARPASVGGVLAEFDGKTWKTFEPRNSGFSGAEPLVIVIDETGRRWIGTRTAGVDIYQVKR